MSVGKVLVVPGHEVGGGAWRKCPAYDATGQEIDGPEGHAKCACREISAEPLPSAAARLRWLRRHREEVAEVPWSDAAIAKGYA